MMKGARGGRVWAPPRQLQSAITKGISRKLVQRLAGNSKKQKTELQGWRGSSRGWCLGTPSAASVSNSKMHAKYARSTNGSKQAAGMEGELEGVGSGHPLGTFGQH